MSHNKQYSHSEAALIFRPVAGFASNQAAVAGLPSYPAF